MASVSKLKSTMDGRRFWTITVSRGHGVSGYTTRYYWPDGWSKRAAERGLKTATADFIASCKNGEVLSREEQKQKEAAEKAAQAAAEERAREEAAKIKTFREYGERVFIPAKRITTAEKTRVYYQTALDNHLYPAFGDIRLPELTSAQINAFFLSLQDSSLAHSTILGIYVAMNQLMKMAYLDDTIPLNPMDKVQRPRQRKDEKKKAVEAFTDSEIKDIFKCLDKEPLKWRALVHLLADTGIRRGEACALRWDHVDLKRNAALIDLNAGYSKERGVFLTTPKTGREREVYFSPATAELLKQLREEQISDTKRRTDRLIREKKPLPLSKVTVPDFVFAEKAANAPMHPDSPGRYLQHFSEAYGIAIHAHKLRHTFASLAITNGADVASVSEVLGHADKGTTLRMYTHASEDSKRRAASIVFAAIGNG